MATNRSNAVRHLAAALSARFEVQVEAVYDSTQWRLEWIDGPVQSRMKTAVKELAPADLDPELFELSRSPQDRAVAVQLIRMARKGQLPSDERIAWRLLSLVGLVVNETDYPDRPVDERAQVMAQRLMDASRDDKWKSVSDIRMAELVLENGGISWLLPTPIEAPTDVNAALELITARYAIGEAAQAWHWSLVPLDLGEALRLAQADPEPDAEVALALVTLAAEHRRRVSAELDADLADAVRAARAAGVPWEVLGQAQGGLTRQGASQLYGRLLQRGHRSEPST
ncbi:hypothetical protein ACIBHX_46930 [Nonomuraea sp. NPDC050536]|uniref:hypothetical protein n=1 Tax=Nonomuraea sp. NPDC050536 TaxID=3364366 RepID=UPI0037C76F27